MHSLFLSFILAATAIAAPISVVQRQGGQSPSFRDMQKPILAPFYVYFGLDGKKTLSQAFDDLGMKAATIGFASAPQGKCELVDDLNVLEANNNIKDFLGKGGAISLSFGGNLGDKSVTPRQHVQQACTTEDDLANLFKSSMDRFQTHNIDIDIEDNDLLADGAAADRLAKALAKVKSDIPDAFITYTMGTGSKGMGGDQVKQLQAAKAAGLDLDGVLLMTMNMLSAPGDNVQASQDAITGGAKQVSDALGISIDDATKKMGMVPAIGVDNNGIVIDLNGAKTLAGFSKKNNMVIQSYWSFNRDSAGGDPKAAQSLTSSSSPDQKADGDFFKSMNDAINGGDTNAGADTTNVAKIAPGLKIGGGEVRIGQKPALPAAQS